jgi:DNA repair photolyase
MVLAKGSCSTPERRRLVDRICSAYPRAEIVEQPSVPHNKVAVHGADPRQLHDEGRRMLVLGEHHSAVGYSDEAGNTCPNFRHFSPYGYCHYGCHYCYLAGTQEVRCSPTVKIFLNLEEILQEIDRRACQIGGPKAPVAFYLGKLQDGMALDPLTGYSRVLIPFFAEHPLARLRVLSKSADFVNVLDLNHRGHTVLSWTFSPAVVQQDYEPNAPTGAERIEAAKQCAAAGYPIRAMLMPIIPVRDWQRHYDALLETLLSQVQLDRITLGGICSYRPALKLMERKLGRENLISRSLTPPGPSPGDGRARYPPHLRREIYSHVLATIRRYQPDLTCALCMEDAALARGLGLGDTIGRCTCVLCLPTFRVNAWTSTIFKNRWASWRGLQRFNVMWRVATEPGHPR